MLNHLLMSGYAIDAVEPYLLWVTVGLIAVLILAGLAVYFFKTFRSYLKAALAIFVFYALILGVVVLIMEIVKHYDAAYLEENGVNKDIIPYVFVPLLVTVALALVSAAMFAILLKYRPAAAKKTAIVCSLITLVSLITAIVLIGKYYTAHIVGDGYYTSEKGKLNSAMLYVCAAALVVAATAAGFILGRNDKGGFDTHCLALAGICVAMSFALSYIKLVDMPQGGSITLASMLPVMLFAYIYGPKKGLLVGLVYGMLQAVQDPYIVHPAQFLLDYPIAFAMVGFAGVFSNVTKLEKAPQVKFGLGAALAGSLRYFAHILSGVFAFGAYAADEGFTNFWAYSAAYNTCILIDAVIVIVVGAILFTSKSFNGEVAKLNNKSFVSPEKSECEQDVKN